MKSSLPLTFLDHHQILTPAKTTAKHPHPKGSRFPFPSLFCQSWADLEQQKNKIRFSGFLWEDCVSGCSSCLMPCLIHSPLFLHDSTQEFDKVPPFDADVVFSSCSFCLQHKNNKNEKKSWLSVLLHFPHSFWLVVSLQRLSSNRQTHSQMWWKSICYDFLSSSLLSLSPPQQIVTIRSSRSDVNSHESTFGIEDNEVNDGKEGKKRQKDTRKEKEITGLWMLEIATGVKVAGSRSSCKRKDFAAI